MVARDALEGYHLIRLSNNGCTISSHDGPPTRRAFPKFESYGMLETAAFRGWKAQDVIEWFHGIGRLVPLHSGFDSLSVT
jgi:hypothetical protein